MPVETPQEASQEQAKEQLQHQILQAQECQQALQNGVLGAWFRDFGDTLLDKLDDVPLSDREGRQRIADLLWLSRKMKANLEQTVTQGYLAKDELEHLAGRTPPQIGDIPYDG